MDQQLHCCASTRCCNSGFTWQDRQSDGWSENKLETAYSASGGKKVTIISYSTGGLLVRCFISINQDVVTVVLPGRIDKVMAGLRTNLKLLIRPLEGKRLL
jgi:hypothetical protein